LPGSQKFRGIVVVILIFVNFRTFASQVVKRIFTPEHPIFSLAAQMRMRYEAVDHDGVTMLGRSDTVLFSNV
jgi:methylmalonyl-CoA mutase cobalamin-binding subunit